jgi:hypothetical protein
MGVTVLIVALVVLNAAGRAGRLKPALAVAAAVAGCVAASVTRYVIGATPVAEGPAFMVNAFITWFVPAAVLVKGYVFYLHIRAVREQGQRRRAAARSAREAAVGDAPVSVDAGKRRAVMEIPL